MDSCMVNNRSYWCMEMVTFLIISILAIFPVVSVAAFHPGLGRWLALPVYL